ncbi:MAG: helix-turn-helix domain-containing protein [Woeseiaceae bacterium]
MIARSLSEAAGAIIVNNPDWTFLSNYAHVLVCLAENPGARLRDVAETVGITERSAQRLISHLDSGGILTRVKQGRRNMYYIDTSAHLRHPIEEDCTVGELLKLVLSPARVRRLAQNKAAYDKQSAGESKP